MPMFLVACALSLIMTHSLLNADLFVGLWWPVLYPAQFLTSFAIVLCWGRLIAFATRSYRWMILWSLFPLWILGVISAVKRQNLGTFLYPWDFYLSNEALSMIPAILESRARDGIWFTALAITAILAFRAIPGNMDKLSPRRRWFGFLLSALTLAAFLLANNPLHDRLFKKEFSFDMASSSESFRVNGIVVGFILLAEQGEFYPPADYSVDSARALFDERRHASAAMLSPRSPATKEHPDIVVIMSESLFDPTELKGIHWNEDPLSFTRGLVAGRSLSAAIVPTYGYRTANSEFEFLTGHAVEFFAKGTIPYLHLIKDHQLSMVETLHRAGYATTAIHPGARTFYERERVYQHFGFDHFYSAETFTDAPMYGNYYSDRSIIPLLKRSFAEANGPSFHFIVTLQNHYPYMPNPFKKESALFSNDGLSAPEAVVMNYYAELVQETDRFHKELTDVLREHHRPTLLVIFGDHLPSLLPAYQTYLGRMIDTAAPANWTPTERRKMMTTPLAFWSNFGYPEEKESLDIGFVGMRMLRNLGIPMSPYQSFVARVSDHVRVLDPKIQEVKDEESQKLLREYKTFQYATFAHDLPDFADEDMLATVTH